MHGEFPAGNWPQKIDAEIDGRSALSFARLLQYDEVKDRSLLDVRIDSGRKHQIRKHLSGMGFPVVGDRLYGLVKENEGKAAEENETEEDLQLCATSLHFACPVTGEEKHFQLAEELLVKL